MSASIRIGSHCEHASGLAFMGPYEHLDGLSKATYSPINIAAA